MQTPGTSRATLALMILSIIFCAVLLFIAFNSIIRNYLFCANCLLSTSNSNSNHEELEEEDPERPKDSVRACTAAPETMMVFSKETGTAAAECLSEFVEGDGIRVVPACNHVFHVKCVDKCWLALGCSCPTCRSSTVICSCPSIY